MLSKLSRLFVVTFMLTLFNVSAIAAKPEITITTRVDAIQAMSTLASATVYMRIASPDGQVEELKNTRYIEWSPAVGAAEGQYHYDVYSYLEIEQEEMSKQKWEQAIKASSSKKSGSFEVRNGVILSDGSLRMIDQPTSNAMMTVGLTFNQLWTTTWGYVSKLLVSDAAAQNFTISSSVPTLNFDDTDETGGNEWGIIVIDSATDFVIGDAIGDNNHRVLTLTGADGVTDNGDSIVVLSNGDIRLADDDIFIDRSANTMGIGTTTPQGSLHIVDTFLPELVLQTAGEERWELEATSSSVGINMNDGNLIFYIEDGAAPATVVLDSSSNVGIGTTPPTEKLDVRGSAIVTGSFKVGSSRSLKKDIRNLNAEEARQVLNNLSPVHFRYKDEQEMQLGFIAEDVPELIADKDKMSIRPMDVIALLTSVAQQHEAEKQTLKAELEGQNQLINQQQAFLDKQGELIKMLMQRVERLETQ